MSGNDLRGESPAGREARLDQQSSADERAPVFGRWRAWYLLVVLDLAFVIALCGWLTLVHR